MTPSPKNNLRRFILAIGFFRVEPGWESSEGFSINLIRPRSFLSLLRRLIPFAVLGYVVVQALVLLFLLLWASYLKVETVHLDQSVRRSFPSSSSRGEYRYSLDQLSQRARAELARLKAALVIEKDKFWIAGKLAGIVSTIPARVWISSIRWDALKRTMSIEACFLVDTTDSEQLPVNSWINALKKDPGFSPGLKTIEPVNSDQPQTGTAEISQFTIRAGW